MHRQCLPLLLIDVPRLDGAEVNHLIELFVHGILLVGNNAERFDLRRRNRLLLLGHLVVQVPHSLLHGRQGGQFAFDGSLPFFEQTVLGLHQLGCLLDELPRLCQRLVRRQLSGNHLNVVLPKLGDDLRVFDASLFNLGHLALESLDHGVELIRECPLLRPLRLDCLVEVIELVRKQVDLRKLGLDLAHDDFWHLCLDLRQCAELGLDVAEPCLMVVHLLRHG